MRAGATHGGSADPRHRIPVLPTTGRGRWAVGLAIAGVGLTLAWSVIPGGAGIGFFCGLAGGAVALVAIVRDRERAVTVFLTLVPFLWVVVFILAELLIGHD